MTIDFDSLVNAPVVATFGQAGQGKPLAVYTPAGHAAFNLDGLYDEAWEDVSISMGRIGLQPLSTTKPRFACRLADFPAGVVPAANDTMVVNTRSFEVVDTKPGDFGWVYLILSDTTS